MTGDGKGSAGSVGGARWYWGLGGRSMNDITLLAHQEPVFGAAPGDTTVRRTLELADPRTSDKIARARAAIPVHVWSLICARPAGFPWLAVTRKLLAGWLVIDLDSTLITAHSDKEGAAPTFKMGYGFHPLAAWCANTAESLAMLLRRDLRCRAPIMCGIAGAIDTVADRATARVRLLNGARAHRGPDHAVVTRVGAIALGNTRLAVQDPTPARNQPFVSPDGRYACVFNGEIYNHRQLAERFRLPVRTACDGEVISQLWAKLGVESLAEVRGMFAIVLADMLEECLHLARDPFGIKPLYWRQIPDGSLVFASEVRPLARLVPGARVPVAAVARYPRYRALAADQSPFLETHAVRPDGVVVARQDRHVEVRPVRPYGPVAIRRPSPGLGAALRESIDLHLGTDVPTALLLSGGGDSATVAAVSRHVGRDLHCLTVAVGGATDEAPGAARTAQHYAHRHQRVHAAVSDDVARFFLAMQRPSVDGLNTYLTCRAVREAGFKVALSGVGGDEAVGGYSHCRLLKYLLALRFSASPGHCSEEHAQGPGPACLDGHAGRPQGPAGIRPRTLRAASRREAVVTPPPGGGDSTPVLVVGRSTG